MDCERARGYRSRFRQWVFFLALSCLAGCRPPDPRLPSGAPDAPRSYALYCAGCHGPDGRHGPPAARLGNTRRRSIAEVRTIITSGSGGMPAWGKRLSPDQIDALADYVKRLGAGGRD